MMRIDGIITRSESGLQGIPFSCIFQEESRVGPIRIFSIKKFVQNIAGTDSEAPWIRPDFRRLTPAGPRKECKKANKCDYSYGHHYKGYLRINV
jgi:hypothetical protein